MHTCKFGVYQLLSITSVCLTLFYMCPSIRLRFRNLQQNQHNWESCSRLSIECTPPSFVSVRSSPSPLSAKHCSMCVHRSVQDFKVYRIISRPVPISKAGGTIGRAVVGCQSNAHHQVWCLSAPIRHLCLLNFVSCVSIDTFKI